MTGVVDGDLQRRVEAFLYAEARLLDRWELEAWLALFTADGVYQVASPGVDDEADADDHLFYVNDDRYLLSERIVRLRKPSAHAEFPHSTTRRMVTNVLVTATDERSVKAEANFLVFRTKFGATDMYPGHYLYDLAVEEGALKIRHKRVMLDIDDLFAQSKVSIIL